MDRRGALPAGGGRPLAGRAGGGAGFAARRGRGGDPAGAGTGERTGADTSAIQVDLASDPVTASYQIAALAPVDPLDGLAMLSSAGPASRLRLCLELLDDVAEDLREQLGG